MTYSLMEFFVDTVFPKKPVLWSGAILGGIVNAVMTARWAFYANYRRWYRNHYVLNGSNGTEAVITFAGGHWLGDAPLVGVFHDVHSDRTALKHPGQWDLDRFFQGCPSFQRSLAEQFALPYLEQEVHGQITHRVTAALWDQGEHLAAADPWKVLVTNGADQIEKELVEDREYALVRFQLDYGMSLEQVAFVRSLFERKIVRPAAMIQLAAADVRWLETTFEDSRTRSMKFAQLEAQAETVRPERSSKLADADLKWLDSLDSAAEAQKAMKICRELFAEMGIIVPEEQ